MTEIDWDLATDTLEAQKCVLLLGPEILVSETIDFHSELLKELNDELEGQFNYHEQDGFFMLNQASARTQICYKIKNFYKSVETPDVLTKISQIPFSLILSINPDFLIREAYKNQGFKYQFSFFNKKKNMNEIEKPTIDNPLIYNLFGSIDEHDSLVLTHDDMFVFLQSILGSFQLPLELQTALQNADYFIFLGFKFEKWYVQLIIRLLNLHLKKDKMQYAFNKNLSQNIKTFYHDEFTINFVDNDISDFVNHLHKLCSNYDILKKSQTNEKKQNEFENFLTSKKVEILVEAGNFVKAIEILKTFYESKLADFVEDVVLLSSRLSRVNRKIDKGMIDNKEAELEFANIANSLLNLNKEVKNLENN